VNEEFNQLVEEANSREDVTNNHESRVLVNEDKFITGEGIGPEIGMKIGDIDIGKNADGNILARNSGSGIIQINAPLDVTGDLGLSGSLEFNTTSATEIIVPFNATHQIDLLGHTLQSSVSGNITWPSVGDVIPSTYTCGFWTNTGTAELTLPAITSSSIGRVLYFNVLAASGTAELNYKIKTVGNDKITGWNRAYESTDWQKEQAVLFLYSGDSMTTGPRIFMKYLVTSESDYVELGRGVYEQEWALT
jgi:hypothetical protein